MTRQRRAVERGRRRLTCRPRRQPADDEPRIEGVAGARRVAGRETRRRDFEACPFAMDPGEDRRALRPALDDRDRGVVEQAVLRPTAQERVGLGGGREQEVGREVRDERPGRPPAPGEQRPDRGEVDAHRGPGGTTQRDGPPAGPSEWLAEERVDRQVDDPGVAEPVLVQVVGAQPVGGAPVGHETAFAAGRHDHPDPSGRLPATRTTRGVTPSDRTASTSARPPDRARPRR